MNDRPQPVPPTPVWLRPEEVDEILAINDKTGELATVVRRIRSAQSIRNTK